MNEKRLKKIRILVGVAAPLAALALISLGVILLSELRQGPPCWFYRVTGLYCPGCGMGRAALALVDGNFLLAIRNQPLMMILLPLTFYYLLKVYIAFVFGKDILPFFKVDARLVIVIVSLIAAFWILRNIPIEPFTYLAPLP